MIDITNLTMYEVEFEIDSHNMKDVHIESRCGRVYLVEEGVKDV